MTTRYDIHTDVRYRPLEVIDLGALADRCPEKWWNQTLCRVNDCVARVGVFEGEFHWHKHDREDELFYVVEGRLLLDLEDHGEPAEATEGRRPGAGARDANGPAAARTVELGPRQGMVVPKGVLHRTRAEVKTVVLMVEAATVAPTGDR